MRSFISASRAQDQQSSFPYIRIILLVVMLSSRAAGQPPPEGQPTPRDPAGLARGVSTPPPRTDAAAIPQMDDPEVPLPMIRPRTGRNLMIIGSVVGGSAYVAYAVVGGISGQSTAAVPLAGPLIHLEQIAAQGRACKGECIWMHLSNVIVGASIVVDVLAQAAGLAMLIAGASIQKKAAPAMSYKPLRLAPAAGPGLVGLTLQGAF